MRGFVLVFVAFIFLLLQMIAVNKLALGEISPDFPLLLVAYLAIFRASMQGTIIGFIVGFLQDLFNPALLGLNALVKSIMGYVLGQMGARTEPDNAAIIALLLFLAQAGHDLIYMLFYFSLDVGKIIPMFVKVSIPSAMYTALIGVAVHELGKLLGMKVVRAFGKAQQ